MTHQWTYDFDSDAYTRDDGERVTAAQLYKMFGKIVVDGENCGYSPAHCEAALVAARSTQSNR